jgi:hypothetical protein
VQYLCLCPLEDGCVDARLVGDDVLESRRICGVGVAVGVAVAVAVSAGVEWGVGVGVGVGVAVRVGRRVL